jgi:hypothetical protein
MRFFEGFLEGFLTERGSRSKFHENTGFQLSHLSLIQRVRSEKGRFGGFGGGNQVLKKVVIFEVFGGVLGSPEERVLDRSSRGVG